jgi:hypothetical protein
MTRTSKDFRTGRVNARRGRNRVLHVVAQGPNCIRKMAIQPEISVEGLEQISS